MTALVYNFSVERCGEEAKSMKFEFSKSTDITVEFLKKRLEVPSSCSLEVFVESSKSYELVKNDKDLALITDGSKLKIVNRLSQIEESKKMDTKTALEMNEIEKSGRKSPTKEKGDKVKKETKSPKISKKEDKDKTKIRRNSKDEKQPKLLKKDDDKKKEKKDKKELKRSGSKGSVKDKKSEDSPKSQKEEVVKEDKRRNSNPDIKKVIEQPKENTNGPFEAKARDERSEWVLSSEDNEEFNRLFVKADDDEDGFITMDQAKSVFGDYGVDLDIVHQIWNLADKNRLERLDASDHAVVRFIIRAVSKGAQIPSEIPNTLTGSVARGRSSSRTLEDFGNMRGARGRSNAFYSGPLTAPTSFDPSYSSSSSARPNKKPKTNCEGKIKSESSRFKFGYADTIGRRHNMEDEITIFGHYRGKEDEDFIGVFDGHGGKEASMFCSEKLHIILEEKIKTNLDPLISLKEAFLETNNQMKKQGVKGGTTAIVAFCIGNSVYVANAGDSRAVLCQKGAAIRYSTDHKPDVPEESKRIKELGGVITTTVDSNGKVTSRICHQLAVARALGDFQLEPFVTALPEVRGPIDLNIENKNQFLILACDGLWDVVSDQDAVSLIASVGDPEKAAIKLRDYALEKGSEDNVSVVVVQFPPFQEE